MASLSTPWPFCRNNFVLNCKGPKQGPKLETKTGPKNWTQNRFPKFNPGANLFSTTRTRTRRHDLQSVLCSAILFHCAQQTNNFNQTRNGNLRQRIYSNKKHFYMYRPSIVKTCFACARYIVKSHAWENQERSCYYEGTRMRHRKTACFQALVLDPHFAQMLRPLLATLLFPWLAEVRCMHHLLENDAKCESAGFSKTCALHMILSVG